MVGKKSLKYLREDLIKATIRRKRNTQKRNILRKIKNK